MMTTHTGAVETHRIDADRNLNVYDRPSSADLDRQHAGERASAERAIPAAVEAPMAKLRAAWVAALRAGRIEQPDDPAELPSAIAAARARVEQASTGLARLVFGVESAAEAARKLYPPVNSDAGGTVQRILFDGVQRAKVDAQGLRDAVAARCHALSKAARRLADAAAVVERKREELREAERALSDDGRIALCDAERAAAQRALDGGGR